MEKGCIVQQGSHESLILEDGVYRDLNHMQMGTGSEAGSLGLNE
jgi:ABC-type multidrug transport system fused ATPase/permease subunit